jgi:CheY-like chemotaxis protein
VVDDNATNRQILGKMLANWGMVATLADSGSAALAVLRESAAEGSTFALSILDVHMRGMDGFELAEAIYADGRFGGMRIALLTSGLWPGDAARARDLGVAIYLAKPVGEMELLEAIRRNWDPRPEGGADARPWPLLPVDGAPPLRFLVVEDNPVNRLLATRLIEKQNHGVVAVTNGREALERLQSESFDCVLMDVQMPVMDGFEATAAIRERERAWGTHIPVIAMTAHAMSGDAERCLAAGMDGHVTKPIRPADLFAAIESVLRR